MKIKSRSDFYYLEIIYTYLYIMSSNSSSRGKKRKSNESDMRRLTEHLIRAGYDIPEEHIDYLFPNKCWLCDGCLLLQANIQRKGYQLDTNAVISLPFNLDPRDEDYPARLKDAYINGVPVCSQIKSCLIKHNSNKACKKPEDKVRKDIPVPANEAEHSVSQVLLQDQMAGQMLSDRAGWLCDMIENGSDDERAVALAYAANMFIIMNCIHCLSIKK